MLVILDEKTKTELIIESLENEIQKLKEINKELETAVVTRNKIIEELTEVNQDRILLIDMKHLYALRNYLKIYAKEFLKEIIL